MRNQRPNLCSWSTLCVSVHQIKSTLCLLLTFITRLGRYFHQHSGESALRVLTPYACEAGFLDWVKGPRQKSPDLEVEELIMCPMLWCRKSFQSISATVEHVKTCPRLRDGWYWCPFCRHPEKFLECDKSCEVNQQPMLRRKNSKLSRATSFFSRFGRRKPTREVLSKLLGKEGLWILTVANFRRSSQFRDSKTDVERF